MLKLIFTTFIFSTISMIAQVNTEKYRTDEDLLGLAGYLEITGNFKSGNAEKLEGELDGRLDWKTDKNATFLIFDSEHEWVEGKRLSNEGLIHLRNVMTLNSSLKLEFFAQANYDKKILLENRELAGAGIRYELLNSVNANAALGSSYMFEHENYNLPKGSVEKGEVSVSRWSGYIAGYISLNNNVKFTSVSYFQPMFTKFSDYRLFNESNINIELSKLLSIAVNFKVRYDSKPLEGVKNTDTKTTFGIGLRF
jgi:hypothetical protein